MQLSQYISKLLYNHDCVIVPGLGGFVGNYKPARVHPVSHTFHPPFKGILFNKNLIHDDGLLLHTISISKSISYEEAKTHVKEFVRDCKLNLESGEIVKIENVGSLQKESNNNIIFNPEISLNYLEESYGFTSFVSPVIIRKPAHKRLEKKFIDRKPRPEKHKKDRKIYLTYLAFVPVLLITLWFVYSSGLIINNTQHTGVLPVSENMEINKSDNSVDNLNEELSDNFNPVVPLKEVRFDNLDEEIYENPIVFPESKNIVSLPEQPKFYIIGGAFSVEKNAARLIASLRSKGYDAKSAGMNPKGLYYVCYLETEDKDEALLNLAMVRKKDNPSAWLLKK